MIAAHTDRNSFLAKLNKQVRLGDKKLSGFRLVRNELLKRIAGSMYGGIKKTRSRPVNILYDVYSIMAPRLISGQLNLSVTTETYGLMPSAKLLEMAVLYCLKQQQVGWQMRKIVQDALVGIGCNKTALMPWDQRYGMRGLRAKPGQIMASRVSMDDLLIDPEAGDENEYFFIGDRYSLPLDHMRGHPLYNQQAVELLESSDEITDNPPERAEDLSADDAVHDHETNELLRPVEVYDLYLPSRGLVLMMPWSSSAPKKPLREFQWEGPEEGPYDLLTLVPLADNFIGVPPMSVVYDVDDAANEAALKMIRRVRQMKHILAYTSGSEMDAENVTQSQDLETIRVDNPNGLREMMFNGPEVGEYSHVGWLQAQASRLSGNTDTLGGLDTGADTLGQEQILMANAGVRVSDGRFLVNRFGSSIARKFGWFLTHVPGFKIPLTRRPHPGVEFHTEYTREQIEGEHLDFHYDFNAYTRLELDPAQKVARQMQWAGEIVPLALQLAMQTQGKFPWQKLIRSTGELLDIPNLDEFAMDEQGIDFAELAMQAYPPEGQGQMVQGRPKMNLTPQHAYGGRDNRTVTNGRYSHRPQSGMVQPKGV